MKTFTNAKELRQLNACADGYETFVKAHGENDATLSQCLESNGWDDVWWLIKETEIQFSDQQKYDLRVYKCQKALINIKKIKPHCSDCDYNLIVDYLNNPIEKKRKAAESAAKDVVWAADSEAMEAVWAARKSAEAAKRKLASISVVSVREAAWAARAAWSSAGGEMELDQGLSKAARDQSESDLRDLFLKWESES